MGRPLVSVCSEAAGLLSILKKVEVCYDQQLMIFTDCLNEDKTNLAWFRWRGYVVVHFDLIFPLIQKLRRWSKRVVFIKSKSHACCFLHEMADKRAETGRMSDADPVFLWSKKYGPYNFELKPYCRFKWQKTILMILSAVMKLPIKTSYRDAILFVLSYYEHSTLQYCVQYCVHSCNGDVVHNIIASC